jgi:hypothetical protein
MLAIGVFTALAVGDVGADRGRAAARLLMASATACAFAALPVVHGDVGAGFRQRQGNCLADAPGSARHQGDPPPKINRTDHTYLP